jgi:uncharacterized protein (DUF1330 family)
VSALLVTIARLRQGGHDALRQYVAGVVPLIAAAGGTVLTRGRPRETVAGDCGGQPDLVAVIRFPDAGAIRAFLDSPAYRAHVRFRNDAFDDLRSYVADDLMAPSEERGAGAERQSTATG